MQGGVLNLSERGIIRPSSVGNCGLHIRHKFANRLPSHVLTRHVARRLPLDLLRVLQMRQAVTTSTKNRNWFTHAYTVPYVAAFVKNIFPHL